MKRAWLLVLSLPALVRAQAALEDYNWRAPVTGRVESGQLYRIKVPAQVFDLCKSYPADIRVFADTAEWPFFVWMPTNEMAQIALTPMPADVGDQKVGVQSLVMDTGARHRPVQRLVFALAETNFARPLKVFGRNGATNQWRWIADGGIHRMEGEARDWVDLRGADYRWLRVDLYRYEEPEVTVKSVSALAPAQYLIFEAGAGRSPFLYFSASRTIFPRYDLHRRRAAEDPGLLPELSIGRARPNPHRVAIGLGRYGHWLTVASLAVVLGLVVLVLGKAWRLRRDAAS